MTHITISGRRIGPGERCFIIAEAGVNHNGQLTLARQLVDAAVATGADAVKFQTFKAERLASARAPKAAYQLETTDRGESQVTMLQRLELPEAYHPELMAPCQRRGILFLSTPFEEASADLLETLGVPAFKIPSGEVTNLPFLAHVARKGRPMILSTGMSTLDEVAEAVRVIRASGDPGLALLHCVSAYPAEPGDANLLSLRTLAESFGVPVGFSDHTPGLAVALAAAALGACIIEKHFTLDRALPGPDHQASLEPQELSELVHGIRTVEAALGHGRKEPVASEQATAAVIRKSLVAARELPSGTVLQPDDLVVKRPGTGIPPGERERVIGRRTRRAVAADQLLSWSDFV